MTFVLEALETEISGRRILRGIDLRARAGEFISIVGRSGSGKSTLLRVLAGLQAPTGGRLQVATKPIMMFQEPRLLPWRSVVQNVCIGLDRPDRAAAERVLSQVGLLPRMHEYPTVLSGGQKQRVALARALMHRPQLMLFDEPFGALDALTRLSMQRLVEDLWQAHGFSAVLVTHDVDEAVLLGDRVLVIDEGQVVHDREVSLPRPRVRSSPEVGRHAAELLQVIFGQELAVHSESLASRAPDEGSERWSQPFGSVPAKAETAR
jgi:sulfonate transport system ATP-binding protein